MEDHFTIALRQRADFRFEADFDVPDTPPLQTDEPPPLGTGTGPNPARLLAVAVANCLAASLLFAMRKFKNQSEPINATATVSFIRNLQNRLRIGKVAVDLHLGAPASNLQHLDRILAQFEEFCVVTQSVRAGITVKVQVFDVNRVLLHAAE